MRIHPRHILLASCVLFLLLSGCETTNDQYYWGNYEELVYEMYTKPGKATPEVQIEKLNRDIQYASNNGKYIAPGIYAHLGFMYAAVNMERLSKEAFHKEMELYPDSRVLIEGMLKRAEESTKRKGL